MLSRLFACPDLDKRQVLIDRSVAKTDVRERQVSATFFLDLCPSNVRV